jgi:hypothetical protein
MEKKMKIRLADLVLDPALQVRDVNDQTVMKYANAMRTGAQFPPVLVEEGTNRVVCGFHRTMAMRRVYTPEHIVGVESRIYKSELDALRDATRDNATHGLPLTSWDIKRLVLRFNEAGATLDELSGLLNMPLKRLQRMAGMTVVVVGKRGKTEFVETRPLKRGCEHLVGKRISEKAYEAHASHDRGIGGLALVNNLRWRLENGFLDLESPELISGLRVLNEAIARVLASCK